MIPEESSKEERSRRASPRRDSERIKELEGLIEIMQAEINDLRRKLSSAASEHAENMLYEAERELVKLRRRNRDLTSNLSETKESLELLREKVDMLSAPPNNYGAFLGRNEDGTVDISLMGKKMRVNADPSLDAEHLEAGQEVIVNSAYNVIAAAEPERSGEVVRIKQTLDGDRALLEARGGEERVAHISGSLKSAPLKSGDRALLNSSTGLVVDRLPQADSEDLLLEEAPDVSYEDIGGLDNQIEQIRDAVELPYLYPDQFKEFNLGPPKGILLYGPPGCGKTLIAKAVANSIAQKGRELSNDSSIRAYFINIKGPELLNKYVGETERKIREVFQRAREKAQEGMPVVIFFDEMDSLFRTRGLGISSDMESTLVPQFLAEIDGVEALRNVIVIGASNRQDLLDPAVLRPGRLDVKIKIDRPDMEAARDIFKVYLTPDLPLAPSDLRPGETAVGLVERMIDKAVEQMYAENDESRFLELTYARGEKETLYFKDFVSGAMVMNIVARAKKIALKRYVDGGEKGISFEDIRSAVKDEFKENEDLPNTKNPDEWASISGRKGERIVNVRRLMNDQSEQEKRKVRVAASGPYL